MRKEESVPNSGLIGRKVWLLPQMYMPTDKLGVSVDFDLLSMIHPVRVIDFFGDVLVGECVSIDSCGSETRFGVLYKGKLVFWPSEFCVFDEGKVHNIEYVFKRDDIGLEEKLDICFKESSWWTERLVAVKAYSLNDRIEKSINKIAERFNKRLDKRDRYGVRINGSVYKHPATRGLVRWRDTMKNI